MSDDWYTTGRLACEATVFTGGLTIRESVLRFKPCTACKYKCEIRSPCCPCCAIPRELNDAAITGAQVRECFQVSIPAPISLKTTEKEKRKHNDDEKTRAPKIPEPGIWLDATPLPSTKAGEALLSNICRILMDTTDKVMNVSILRPPLQKKGIDLTEDDLLRFAVLCPEPLEVNFEKRFISLSAVWKQVYTLYRLASEA